MHCCLRDYNENHLSLRVKLGKIKINLAKFCDVIVFRYELTFGLTKWRCSEDAEWVPIAPRSDVNQVPVCSPSKLSFVKISVNVLHLI